jgi:uncharacterized protein
MLIGHVEALRRYPVKSLRGEALDSVRVESSGIPGDRAAAFMVTSGHARVGKTYRGKENDRLHLQGDARAATALAEARGVALDLRHGEHFFDDAPISIIVDSWLVELSRHVGYAVEWERFRPNFFVLAASGFELGEESLSGAELQLGTVTLRVRYPIERCVTPNYHPEGLGSDPRILRFLAQHRNTWMGIYCDVVTPGVVKASDALTLPDEGGAAAATPHPSPAPGTPHPDA